VFASDEQVDSLTLALIPGAEWHRLWGADQAPTFPCVRQLSGVSGLRVG
jgi:hypothetical protein